MCTVTVLRRPSSAWPLIMAANRDEMVTRAWKSPARHWSDRPDVVGGLDELAGGSWLAMNDHGVVAAILNRFGTLGPQEGKRSRGELVLDALDHADAAEAAAMLAQLDGHAYRPFNMVVADNRDAFWICHRGESSGGRIYVDPLPEGVSMVTAYDVNASQDDPRIARFLPRFQEIDAPVDAAAGEVSVGDAVWGEWEQLLTSGGRADLAGQSKEGLCFLMESGFGTVSSSLIALPSIEKALTSLPVWRFCGDPRGDKPSWYSLF